MIGPAIWVDDPSNILRCGCPASLTGQPIVWLADDGVTELYGVVLSGRWTSSAGEPEHISVMPHGTQRNVRVYRDGNFRGFVDADLKRYRNPVQ